MHKGQTGVQETRNFVAFDVEVFERYGSSTERVWAEYIYGHALQLKSRLIPTRHKIAVLLPVILR